MLRCAGEKIVRMRATVFVSSRIVGMEALRATAKTAIEAMEYEPLMAEDFPSTPTTPRGACLDAVRKADLVALLVGPSYGEVQQSGKSATEEEVEEARRLSKPVLVFKVHGEVDRQQQEFLQRIGSWADGTLFVEFADRDELLKELLRALRQHEHAPAKDAVLQLVQQRLGVVVIGERGRGYMTTTPRLSVAWVPVCSASIVDEDRFFAELAEKIADDFVSGPARLGDVRPTIRTETDRLVVRCDPKRQGWDDIELIVWRDGSMALGYPLRQENSSSIQRMLTLPPSLVQSALTRILTLFRSVTDFIDGNRVIRQGGLQAVLENLGMAHLRDAAPSSPGGGTPIRMGRDAEQLLAPSQPTLIARPELSSTSPVAERLVRQLQRASVEGQVLSD